MGIWKKSCVALNRTCEPGWGRLVAGLLALGLLLAGGCAPLRPPVEGLPAVDALTLMKNLEVQGRRFHSLQGTASLRLVSGEEEQNVKQVLLIQRPDLFRAEVLGLFGQPVVTVAAADDRLSALVPGESAFYTGPATPENLYRLVRFPLELRELLQFVFCDVPLLPGYSGLVEVDEGLYSMRRHAQDGREQRLYFDRQKQLRQVSYSSDGMELLRVEYRTVRPEDGLPQQIYMSLPAVDMELELIWRDVRVNAEIPAIRFRLTPPAGVQIRNLP